jgi:hypothetical protein
MQSNRKKVVKYLGKGIVLLECGHTKSFSIRRTVPKTVNCGKCLMEIFKSLGNKPVEVKHE